MRTQVWYNPDLVNAYNMVPAMIGMILQFLTLQLTAAAIVRERGPAPWSSLPSRL